MRTVCFHRAGQRGRDEPAPSPRVAWRLPVALLVQSCVISHLEGAGPAGSLQPYVSSVVGNSGVPRLLVLECGHFCGAVFQQAEGCWPPRTHYLSHPKCLGS